MNRRGFLKTLGMGAACAAAPTALPAKAGAKESGDTVLATMYDLSECVGCGACVEACREANAHKYPEPTKPFPRMRPSRRAKPEDFSEMRDLDDRLTPYNWLFIQSVDVSYQGREYSLNIPRRCMHCRTPACADLCPWGAAFRKPDGAVNIDPDICLGGAKCRTVCPWHIPQRQSGVGLYLDLLPSLAGNGVMYKCDRCKGRDVPACVEACPFEVQSIGPRDEIAAKAKARAEEMGGFIYGLEENGGTNTFYVSPVPFELVNQQLQTGKGRPHLDVPANPMEDESMYAGAALAAPLAGVAAGVLRLVKNSKDAKASEEQDDG